MKNRNTLYKRVKLAGFISSIPIVLFSSPLAGYVIGEYVRVKLRGPESATAIFCVAGLVAGIAETVRIIRAAVKLQADTT